MLENMVLGLDKNKYKIYVVSFLNTDIEEEVEKIKNNNAEYINLGLKRKIDILLYGKRKIMKVIKKIKPDVIHSHGIFPDIIASSIKNVKKITTIHCNIYEDYRYSFGKIMGPIYAFIHKIALEKFDNAVCCSKSVYDELKKTIKNNKLTYVRNGIKEIDNVKKDIIRKEIRKKLKITNNEIIYLYVGALSKRKNVLELAKNMNNNLLKNEHVIFLGDGEYYQELKKIENKNFHILGFCTNPLDYMMASDIYISASISEGLSISIIEALENELFLLLSDIRSHNEFFSVSKAYIGETFNVDFKEKISQLRKQISKANKNKLSKIKKEFFSEKSMIKGYQQIYGGK